MIPIAIYAVGWVATLVIAARTLEAQYAPLDFADVVAACFFATAWPIYLPFLGVAWIARFALRRLGVEVDR